VDEMFITHIDGDYDADTFFPEFDVSEWKKELLFKQEIDDRHKNRFEVFRYTFIK